MLVVSQFTLHGDTAKGRRQSWINAARPEHAEPLVELVNDGPVALMLELKVDIVDDLSGHRTARSNAQPMTRRVRLVAGVVS